MSRKLSSGEKVGCLVLAIGLFILLGMLLIGLRML
jgi:hypothetical protein